MIETQYEEVVPSPETFIKSIAEQGYTLETALADLMDNSISANADKIEVLSEIMEDKITLYIADNGIGMSESQLAENMKFPSRSVDSKRDKNDLGRFGLGMKTASFSQTRKFTVISREIGTTKFYGRTWDVDYLRVTGKWRIKINTEEEIKEILNQYTVCSKNHQKEFDSFLPNTIITWDGLYKFENYLNPENQFKHFKEQLNRVTFEYLGIVFHNFMERLENPLQIRINNKLIEPFNPFKSKSGKQIARSLGVREMQFEEDVLKMEAFILPVSACDDESQWTTENNNLLDLEGLYIYRGDRVIFFGGWNNIIKKEARLKLARLKIQVGNLNDVKLQLNVSKSKISIPYELKQGVLRYIVELRNQAKKEYNNRGVRKKSTHANNPSVALLSRTVTTKGVIYEINKNFPLVNVISKNLNDTQKNNFNFLLRSINLLLNKQRHSDEDYLKFIEEEDNKNLNDIEKAVKGLLENGINTKDIFEILLKDLGYNKNNLTENLKKILDIN
ncbi:ATP-binding protein [Gelidibacter japonicus]|jgi:hypothetical protein|uniref:ATP-binding protein n=1 Tax=Gelidibacter japonicus TaxID=1962232 RepID=UPI00202040EA|nr:ATP-binding protein [Gelidibacter japonicus]MCL8007901.1 ATP-binding protein [Gelidibacter japonicus]